MRSVHCFLAARVAAGQRPCGWCCATAHAVLSCWCSLLSAHCLTAHPAARSRGPAWLSAAGRGWPAAARHWLPAPEPPLLAAHACREGWAGFRYLIVDREDDRTWKAPTGLKQEGWREGGSVGLIIWVPGTGMRFVGWQPPRTAAASAAAPVLLRLRQHELSQHKHGGIVPHAGICLREQS